MNLNGIYVDKDEDLWVFVGIYLRCVEKSLFYDLQEVLETKDLSDEPIDLQKLSDKWLLRHHVPIEFLVVEGWTPYES